MLSIEMGSQTMIILFISQLQASADEWVTEESSDELFESAPREKIDWRSLGIYGGVAYSRGVVSLTGVGLTGVETLESIWGKTTGLHAHIGYKFNSGWMTEVELGSQRQFWSGYGSSSGLPISVAVGHSLIERNHLIGIPKISISHDPFETGIDPELSFDILLRKSTDSQHHAYISTHKSFETMRCFDFDYYVEVCPAEVISDIDMSTKLLNNIGVSVGYRFF